MLWLNIIVRLDIASTGMLSHFSAVILNDNAVFLSLGLFISIMTIPLTESKVSYRNRIFHYNFAVHWGWGSEFNAIYTIVATPGTKHTILFINVLP